MRPVVVLAEDARAFVGIGDRIVFEGAFVIAFHGREDDAPPAGAQDAVQLAQGAAVVGHVFQQVVAEDDVHRIVGERNLLHVEMQVRERAFEIAVTYLPAGPRSGVSGGA